jgi:hypothetical protein
MIIDSTSVADLEEPWKEARSDQPEAARKQHLRRRVSGELHRRERLAAGELTLDLLGLRP